MKQMNMDDNQTPTDNFNSQYYNSSPNQATQIEQDEYDPIPPIFSLKFHGRWGRLSYINAIVSAMGVSFAVLGVFVITTILLLGFNKLDFNNPEAYFQSLSQETIITLVVISLALFILYLVWSIRFSVLRLHDLNWSGWWSLLFTFGAFIPFIGSLVSIASLIIYYCLPGTIGENQYGRQVPAGSKVGLIILCILIALYAMLFVGLIVFAVGMSSFTDSRY